MNKIAQIDKKNSYSLEFTNQKFIQKALYSAKEFSTSVPLFFARSSWKDYLALIDDFPKDPSEKNAQILLKKLHQWISEENSEEIGSLLLVLRSKGENGLASLLIDQLMAEFSNDIKKEYQKNYRILCHGIEKAYPETKDCFIFSDDKFRGLNFTCFSDLGINFILNQALQKGFFDKISCTLMPSFPAFLQELEDFVLQNQDNENLVQKIFLVRHIKSKIPFAQGDHISPVYLQKNRDGHYKMIVTDSKGGFGAYNLSFQKAMDQLKQEKLADFSLECIYYEGPSRQHDISNCSLFAIYDAVQFAIDNEALIDFIDQHKEKISSHYQITVLPAKLMRTTQSLSDIEEYTNRVGSVKLKGKYIVTLDSGKNINAKIADTFISYQRLIFKTVMTQIS